MVRILDLTRELYNAALQERRDAWRKAGKSVTVYDQMRLLGEVKAVRPEYQGVYAQVLQETLKRLDRAFQGFFSRVKRGEKAGYPRFRGRGWWDSFTFPQVWREGKWVGPGKPLGNGKIKIPGVGHVRIKQHRPLEGVPKTLTIKRSAGCWYAVYVCEVSFQPLPPSDKAVGIDLGLSHFVATSDGETFAPPKAYRKAEAKLARTQQALSRKKRGSNRYKKLKMRLARQHQKIANRRRDFHHKLARNLVNRYGTIVHEDLRVSRLSTLPQDFQLHTPQGLEGLNHRLPKLLNPPVVPPRHQKPLHPPPHTLHGVQMGTVPGQVSHRKPPLPPRPLPPPHPPPPVKRRIVLKPPPIPTPPRRRVTTYTSRHSPLSLKHNLRYHPQYHHITHY
ncbi:hypothetical protein CSW35_03765 [Thermus scotoductus]|nr:hypothetical protein CSW35_03765 [Thermus scotoductus]